MTLCYVCRTLTMIKIRYVCEQCAIEKDLCRSKNIYNAQKKSDLANVLNTMSALV